MHIYVHTYVHVDCVMYHTREIDVHACMSICTYNAVCTFTCFIPTYVAVCACTVRVHNLYKLSPDKDSAFIFTPYVQSTAVSFQLKLPESPLSSSSTHLRGQPTLKFTHSVRIPSFIHNKY